MNPGDESLSNYLGLTHFGEGQLKKGFIVFPISRVTIRLKRSNGTFFEIARLVPTLLHEFAHCITEEIIPENLCRNRKLKSLFSDHTTHGAVFYRNFAAIIDLGSLEHLYNYSYICLIVRSEVIGRV
eukprot:TRINITY_DN1264_c0_g1_i2.p1 TRINITY_DN1264_c0_g1~~TRINITY_DN1264_c0_g1_i2.p1  ORF type:complete len:127 (+),score=8.61 TRINITY_DN1264_c0_g1_i2:147-527(+)